MSDDGEPAPLQGIERKVQARAKEIALDLDDRSAVETLTRLVDEEIREWNDDHRRGIRPFGLTDVEGLAERALRNLTGYGPLGPLLADELTLDG